LILFLKMSSSANSASTLQEATRNSTVAWQQDLAALFQQSKERFPDVVWELSSEDDDGGGGVEEVFGHQGVCFVFYYCSKFTVGSHRVRACAAVISDAVLFIPATGARVRALVGHPRALAVAELPRCVARAQHHDGRRPDRLQTSINPALFSNELEYLYTGQGFGEAFEFLFDEQGDTADLGEEDARLDKLHNDLVFMWRSRLYSDVRIALTSNEPLLASTNDDAHKRQLPVFSSHRFLLASHSPYFHTALISWPSKTAPTTLSLPSPPLTPARLHLMLRFLYTGTLVSSHCTYDL
jgi:hypothetical protein